MTDNLKISKCFLHNGQQGHTWHCTVPIKVNREEVLLRAFLWPNFCDGDTPKKATLLITVKVNPALYLHLVGCCKQCWVQIDTDVMDKNEGKSLNFLSERPHKITTNEESYYHDLVTYEQLESCKSKTVNLMMKATFITAPLPPTFTQSSDDDFVKVDKMQSEEDRATS